MRSSITRRNFFELSAAAVLAPSLHAASFPAKTNLLLNQGWTFLGREGAHDAPQTVTLPHTVATLSWQKWQPEMWQAVWRYRRSFAMEKLARDQRAFLRFERVMQGCTPTINGHVLEEHRGGFVPFEYEITEWLRAGENVLELAVDARWIDCPPGGSPKGPPSVDYLLPGGIPGGIAVEVLPQTFLRDVVARSRDVLSNDRALEIGCTLDGAQTDGLSLHAVLHDADRVVARASGAVTASREIKMEMNKLTDVQLWSPDQPHLYRLSVTLMHRGVAVHTVDTRIGFREARFEVDGFYLNGKKLRLFGLNRHELFPYVGFAASPRAMRKDAEILKRDFHCNIVRCSHYPQSTAFLDACDELGLMVWEEIPGWQYIGDDAWKKLAVRDTEAMIRRDRNRPSVVIWGTRVNESRNDVELYRTTHAVAKRLDPTRQTSGSMTPSSMKTWKTDWHEDVLAYDDYHAEKPGEVGIYPPKPGVPYMLAEMVGQFNYGSGKGFGIKYRRAGDPQMLTNQALYHAQANDKVIAQERIAGAIAWCAFDYGSLLNGYDSVKCPGIADVFRIDKPAAAFYRSQCDPRRETVIEPAFAWDFGPATPHGPGKHAPIFSNCERLEVYLGEKHHATLSPDRAGYPHLSYAPFFADFEGMRGGDLRIDGFLGQKKVLTRRFSADHSRDKLSLLADDKELIADGSDTTRVAFYPVDQYDVMRVHDEGTVTLSVEGPGEIVGDNPFDLKDSGGVGAVWIRSLPGKRGVVRLTAKHPALGEASVSIQVR
ncbi:MAG: glycoside hydrolase family 2 protein [Acidobacteria bacterium]|nr:glycoside hydrolase family 2 protein [Acidobacteriota bacterium]